MKLKAMQQLKVQIDLHICCCIRWSERRRTRSHITRKNRRQEMDHLSRNKSSDCRLWRMLVIVLCCSYVYIHAWLYSTHQSHYWALRKSDTHKKKETQTIQAANMPTVIARLSNQSLEMTIIIPNFTERTSVISTTGQSWSRKSESERMGGCLLKLLLFAFIFSSK